LFFFYGNARGYEPVHDIGVHLGTHRDVSSVKLSIGGANTY
jgi:hypothetical protein